MYSRKKVVRLKAAESHAACDHLLRIGRDDPNEAAIQKDVHLLSAALSADKSILSRDDRMRAILRELPGLPKELAEIHWANPSVATEDVLAWLTSGAEPDPARRLVPA